MADPARARCTKSSVRKRMSFGEGCTRVIDYGLTRITMVWLCGNRKAVKRFYENQKNLVEALKEDEKILNAAVDPIIIQKETKNKIWDTRLSSFAVLVNVALMIAKTTAVLLSDSLSVVASLVDSAMDITSGVVLWYTCHLIVKSSAHHYPVGLNRLEPLATLIIGMIMVFSNVFVLQQAAVDCISGNVHPRVDIPTLVILCSGTAVKAVLFIICRSRKTTASRVLTIDQRNDCITNLVALAGAYLGDGWWPYADPIGASVVSGVIIITWIMTVKEQVPLLIGRTASPQLINRIINVAISHDDQIKHLETVHVYHFGANFLVELHVVMDGNTTLFKAHDVAESLENKLEQLSFVERAFNALCNWRSITRCLSLLSRTNEADTNLSLGRGCQAMYANPTGLGPEIAYFNMLLVKKKISLSNLWMHIHFCNQKRLKPGSTSTERLVTKLIKNDVGMPLKRIKNMRGCEMVTSEECQENPCYIQRSDGTITFSTFKSCKCWIQAKKMPAKAMEQVSRMESVRSVAST
ncbi:unnamed protein product [Cylicocyclus nassatus]|uniref:Uncharacterized protein n=1 Tax=Cylicocyclus nassatus TaxID=53992 RepID=A0AA36GH82_CYLNA|nr:unnamed protein product [Cylicocyclus nassatus]